MSIFGTLADGANLTTPVVALMADFKYEIVKNFGVLSESKSGWVREVNLDELEFTVRTYTCLKRAGINTVGDIIIRPISELNNIRNLSPRGVMEVIRKVNSMGLKLKKG